jgi:hypothetical protein
MGKKGKKKKGKIKRPEIAVIPEQEIPKDEIQEEEKVDDAVDPAECQLMGKASLIAGIIGWLFLLMIPVFAKIGVFKKCPFVFFIPYCISVISSILASVWGLLSMNEMNKTTRWKGIFGFIMGSIAFVILYFLIYSLVLTYNKYLVEMGFPRWKL